MDLQKGNIITEFMYNTCKELIFNKGDNYAEILSDFTNIHNSFKLNDNTETSTRRFLRSINNFFRIQGKYGVQTEINEPKTIELIDLLQNEFLDAPLAEKYLICMMLPVWFNKDKSTALSLSLERIKNDKRIIDITKDNVVSNSGIISDIVMNEGVKGVFNMLIGDEDNPYMRKFRNSFFKVDYDGYSPKLNMGPYMFVMVDQLETYAANMLDRIYNEIIIPINMLRRDLDVCLPFSLSFHNDGEAKFDELINHYVNSQLLNELDKKRIINMVKDVCKTFTVEELMLLSLQSDAELKATRVNDYNMYVINHNHINRIVNMDFSGLSSFLPVIKERIRLLIDGKVVNKDDYVYCPKEMLYRIEKAQLPLFKDTIVTADNTILTNKGSVICLHKVMEEDVRSTKYHSLFAEVFEHPLTKKIIDIKEGHPCKEFFDQAFNLRCDVINNVAACIERSNIKLKPYELIKFTNVKGGYNMKNNEFIIYQNCDPNSKYITNNWTYYDSFNFNGKMLEKVILTRIDVDRIQDPIDCSIIINLFGNNIIGYKELINSIMEIPSMLGVEFTESFISDSYSRRKEINFDQKQVFNVLRFITNVEQDEANSVLSKLGMRKHVTWNGNNNKYLMNDDEGNLAYICNRIVNYMLGGNSLSDIRVISPHREYRKAINDLINAHKSGDVKEVIKLDNVMGSITYNEEKLLFLNGISKSYYKVMKNNVLDIIKHSFLKQSIWSSSFNVKIKSVLSMEEITDELYMIKLLGVMIPHDLIVGMSKDEIKSHILSIFGVDMDVSDVDLSSIDFNDMSKYKDEVNSLGDLLESVRTLACMVCWMSGIDLGEEDFKDLDIVKLLI